MAATGFTPISLYYSSTTTNAPSSGNLAAGELAINTADGKLFYKDSSNAIQVIGWKTTPVSAGGTGLTTTPANGALDIGNGTGFTRTTLTAGSNITITNSAGGISIAASSSGGTVTSVAATVPSFLSVAGSPITTSGTLAISLSGTALPVLNGGTGVTTSTGTGNVVLSTSPTLTTPILGTPTSGNLANCTFPTLNQNTTGTAANVTGTVAVANGGTGSTTLTANNVLLGNGTGALQAIAPSTSGNVLTSNGTTWVSSTPGGIGVGQTWQNVTGSRSAGTTYTNSTGKPISVSLSCLGTASASFSIDGIQVSEIGGASPVRGMMGGIVPNGSSYIASGSGLTIDVWAELR